MHAVATSRETNRLCPDPAGAVKNLFCLWTGAPDQLIEGIGLTLNRDFPVLVDKVLVSGKLIIKIARRHV